MATRAPRLSNQPVVEPNGGGQLGRGVEIGQQASRFVQVPTDHGFGGGDIVGVDYANRSVRQGVKQRR